MHILLIDDSSSTRSLLKTLINSGQSVRHEISEAASGEESLQKVSSGEINLPDLIIMDINMGGMSGYDLCREFRQRHGVSEIVPYIIMVTANEGVDVINQALDCGANDYMPKPVNVKILQVRLRVAARMLLQSKMGTATFSHSGRLLPLNETPAEANPTQKFVADAIENMDAPIVILDVAGATPSFRIVYANAAMSSTTQFSPEQLSGKSLADLEAWTPDFHALAVGFIQQALSVSYVPLASQTRQEVPVHLSFYPIRTADAQINQYLVIHHF